jgi:sec-independent protein translocase protein TatB
MPNIGMGEIAVILVVALLVLGPQRLPELARGIGKFVREFRRQTDEVRTVVQREFYKMDHELNKPIEAQPDLVASSGPGFAIGSLPEGHSDPHAAPPVETIGTVPAVAVAAVAEPAPEAPAEAAPPPSDASDRTRS